MDSPLVSVFMPVFNHESYVEAAIDSVLRQSYRNFEIVIGDDCSADRGWEIIESLAAANPGLIKAFRNEVNLGIAGNCTKILQRCSGTYVAFHAGDDLWLPEKLERQVALMEAHPSCALSYHDLDVFDSATGETLFFWNSGPGRPAPVTGSARVVARRIVTDLAGFFGALSVMVRRSKLPANFAYDPRLPTQGELLVWLSCLDSAESTVEYIPEVMARYRKHSAGLSAADHQTQEDFFLAIVENEFDGFARAVRHARGIRYYAKALRRIREGDGPSALSNLGMCFRHHVPTLKIFYWLLRAVQLRIQASRRTDSVSQ